MAEAWWVRGIELMNEVVSLGIERAGISASRPGRLPASKRVLDLALIALIFPGWLLICGMVALIVKLGSKGPVFFRQKRIGHRGAEFTLFKFRTMKVDAETRSHEAHTRHLITSNQPMEKLDARQDPRLAPLAGLLRATGLDELPQLINIIRGEMSLVGPRPCLRYEYEQYEPWQRRRLDAVPGLTGLWQVNGKNETTFRRMVELDIEYSRRQSVWLDIAILFRTFPALYRQCRKLRGRRGESQESAVASIAKSIPSSTNL